jgi:hypothetical protein
MKLSSLTLLYILPQTFREWTIIGIDKDISINKPYHYKIGNLPLVLWYNNSNPQTIINSCHKHLGNTLRDSYIKNNELICPYHKSKYTNEDNLGTIKKENGLLWWSYKSFKTNPPKIKDENNNYHFEVESDFISIIINIICDFGGTFSKFNEKNKKLLMKKDRNYVIYKYPYTIQFNNRYMINIIPINMNKSHIYLTTLKQSQISLNEIEKFKKYMNNRYCDFKYKYFILKDDNSYINKIYYSYKDYMFPDDYTIRHFIMNKRYY